MLHTTALGNAARIARDGLVPPNVHGKENGLDMIRGVSGAKQFIFASPDTPAGRGLTESYICDHTSPENIREGPFTAVALFRFESNVIPEDKWYEDSESADAFMSDKSVPANKLEYALVDSETVKDLRFASDDVIKRIFDGLQWTKCGTEETASQVEEAASLEQLKAI